MAELVETQSDLESIEIKLLLEGIFQHYGYDFRNYSPASMRRRILSNLVGERRKSISSLQDRVLHNPDSMDRLVASLTIHVTEMFRDPGFYIAFREKVVPMLKTYPFVRIWHAGCSSGEEVYSMAILLHEEGLYERCRIYATDISETVLLGAREGIFPLKYMQQYTQNYQKAGGRCAFSDYYIARYDHALFHESLRKNIVFSQHNLVTDGSFNAFNVILCRNVMIYFNEALQKRVHQLIYESLSPFGVLGLGSKESLRFTPQEKSYEAVDAPERLYRRIG